MSDYAVKDKQDVQGGQRTAWMTASCQCGGKDNARGTSVPHGVQPGNLFLCKFVLFFYVYA
jgi:hypothetical protein